MRRRKLLRTAAIAVAALLMAAFSMPAFALAADAVNQPPDNVLTGLPLVEILLGMVTPLVGYLLNHFAPWASEPAKGVVQAVLAAGAGALAQALGAGNFGWNQQTLVAVLTAMGAALAAHLGYKAGGINVALGGGTNADGTPSALPVLAPSKARTVGKRKRRRAS